MSTASPPRRSRPPSVAPAGARGPTAGSGYRCGGPPAVPDGTATWQAGRVSPRVERLWPTVGVWLAVAVAAGFCAVVALPFGSAPAWVTLAVAAGALAAGLLRAAVTV